jgi:hypothetical protein
VVVLVFPRDDTIFVEAATCATRNDDLR